jgi:hypothetical protein
MKAGAKQENKKGYWREILQTRSGIRRQTKGGNSLRNLERDRPVSIAKQYPRAERGYSHYRVFRRKMHQSMCGCLFHGCPQGFGAPVSHIQLDNDVFR